MKKKILSNFVRLSFLLLVIPFLAQAQTLDQALKNLDGERFIDANKELAQLAQTNPNAQIFFYQGYAILRGPEATKPESIKMARDFFAKGLALDPKDKYCQFGEGMAKLASNDLNGGKAI